LTRSPTECFSVADFLAVLGVVIFAAVMFGLIWTFERA